MDYVSKHTLDEELRKIKKIIFLTLSYSYPESEQGMIEIIFCSDFE